MKLRILAAAALAAPALALAQAAPQPEAPPAAAPADKPAAKSADKPAAKAAGKASAKPAAGAVATVNGVAVPRSRVDLMMRQQAARGGQDNDQMRALMREELINRELIAQEAGRSGIAKTADVQAQLDLVRQEIVVGAYIRDWVGKHPITDADVQKEYDRAKAQAGSSEYRARHILLETEDQAKAMIAELKKGGKFDELATKNSKDGGTAQRGGDLDWNVPGTFDRAFSDAMIKLEKGKYTETPVQTRFGYHVILLEDMRPVRFPALAEVKPRLQQQLVQGKIEELVKSLRAKAKIE
jgi:peptidyl-prolyl cis-trans isomerase C